MDMTIEEFLVALENAANMLRGMQLDPSIPPHAKDAMAYKMNEIDTLTSTYRGCFDEE